VCWSDFFSWVSICYFASEKVLATLLFMIFDLHKDRTLDETQVTLLVDLNAAYLKGQVWEGGSEVELDP
jgi:hypothetical protein